MPTVFRINEAEIDVYGEFNTNLSVIQDRVEALMQLKMDHPLSHHVLALEVLIDDLSTLKKRYEQQRKK